jgi:hypothetical protein
MTYNFDPDKWYESELAYLDTRMKSGKISKEEFIRAIEKLEKQYEEIWKRLDGSYQIHQ